MQNLQHPALKLVNFTFEELFHSKGLHRLDQQFLNSLDDDLRARLLAYRTETVTLTPLEISELLIECAKPLEDFIIKFFDIEEAALLIQAQTLSHDPVSAFKKYFVLRRAKKNIQKCDSLPSFSKLDIWLNLELKKFPLQTQDKELAVALLSNQYIANPELFSEEINQLTNWCVRALTSPEGQAQISSWVSFKIPKRMDYDHLVECAELTEDTLQRTIGPESRLRLRDGFQLTDPRMNAREIQDEINYCIYCHDHDGDFCSKGFPVKKNHPELGFKKNPLDLTLTGCPLEEKISEMNFLKREGYTLAALAMVMVDNPMCPATGHRICNDCMKSCIYQKQEPVNIPQIETRVLTDVLSLPWGVEIYDLLTRWNPLRQKQWVMKPYNNLKVLIAGMGPAGFTLAHHLLLEGFAVVGFDGLKIEPLPEKYLREPIYQYDELTESLDERLMAGFGGVAEYGITVRWDKNFLKLIYLSLLRKPYFQVFGSTRFGGTILVDDAWKMGFDHFVIAVGAGLPKALNIPGSLLPGMRQANDFLMALQLGNAAKKNSLSNLQVRLPAVVIGGGLTGVDTATEVQAYYITQVEKTLLRYEKLVKRYGEDFILNQLDISSKEILDEFLAHGKAVQKERERAELHQEKPNFIKLIRQWGGVTIVYRRTMQESPAYINNHEELQKAFEEGIYYLEALEPAAVDMDQFGMAETLICHHRLKNQADQWETTTEEIRIPARAIFVAAGTQPNTAYEFEHRGTFNRVGLQYQHYEDIDNELSLAHGVQHCKVPQFGPFTSYHKQDRRVSLIGDTHPVFHGNVVKAIASGMRTYPKILNILSDKLNQAGDENEYQLFSQKIAHLFTAEVKCIERVADNILELTIQAPLAADHYQPGQFFRLQNYETFAKKIDDTILQMEPLALVASGCDRKAGTLKFIVIEKGVSSKLCSFLRAGELVSLMGPTGIRAKISNEHETVLIIGNQMSLPLLFSYGSALRQAGNHVIYLGIFKDKEVYCKKSIEKIADVSLWANESDHCVDILLEYAMKNPSIPLSDVDRIYLIADTCVLKEFQEAREIRLKEILIKNPPVYASVYSTMQCMLKGVCAQCLQWQIDPKTGKRTKTVFACSWPEQPLEMIDLGNIDERQVQNRLQELLSNMWLEYTSH
ncbi:MAG TPA: FAD-dependent oxidoreductase [Gammaproteobacteria bacterium]|nr:FAD-dependent oxidoreductase [Gammaproteobacteria bacterium]